MRGILVVLLAFAAGCTSWRDYVHNGFKVGPNFCSPAAPVADSWIDAENPNVSTEPPREADWWRTFNDPVLDSLVCTAYRQNLTLRIAGLRILEARAQRAIAAGELFPQTQQLNGAYTRTQGSANAANAFPNRFYDDWTVGSGNVNVAGLAWELDFWGQFRRALESADAHVCSTIYNYDDVLVLLISDVAGNYVTLRTAEQRIQYARKNVEIQKGSLNLADVKFRNGATTRLDVTQGQSNLSQTEATIPPLEAQRRPGGQPALHPAGHAAAGHREVAGQARHSVGLAAGGGGRAGRSLAPPPGHPPRRGRRRRPMRADRRGHRGALSALFHQRHDLL